MVSFNIGFTCKVILQSRVLVNYILISDIYHYALLIVVFYFFSLKDENVREDKEEDKSYKEPPITASKTVVSLFLASVLNCQLN